MKKILIFVSSIIIIMSSGNSKAQTEQQKYTLIQQFPGFEVRFYPPAIMASVNTNANSYRELSTPGFRTLAGYIFGDNTDGKKIAMTAPVHMDIGQDGSSMSFVMPSEYEYDDLPEPLSNAVILEERKPEYVAALTFGGYASDDKIKEESEKLLKYLKDNNITPVGNFRFLGYNSPYKFWKRRNEIIVQIIWD
ncbi:MAG: heme-binding protein [Bacteroidales bacterium]